MLQTGPSLISDWKEQIVGKYDGNSAVEDSSPSHAGYRCVEGAKAPKDNPGFDSNTVIIVRLDAAAGTRLCHCGCETPLLSQKGGGVFRQGHDARFKGILQRAHVFGREVAIVDGGAIISGDAMGFASERGWQRFLEKAEVTAKRAADRATVRKSKQTVGKQNSNAVGNMELLNKMKAAAQVLKDAGMYGRGAGDRKIDITKENVDSILDGTHPGLQPEGQHEEGFAVGMSVATKFRGRSYEAEILAIRGDRAEIRLLNDAHTERVVEISSLVAWDEGK